MRRLVTGRSCRFLGKIPGFASPPLDGFALFSDRIVRQPTWLPTPGRYGPQARDPNGPKVPFGASPHRKYSGRRQAALPGVSSDDRPTISEDGLRDQAIEARGSENSCSSSSAGSGRPR